MAPIFVVKLYISIPIHRCIDHLNPLRIGRDAICPLPMGDVIIGKRGDWHE